MRKRLGRKMSNNFQKIFLNKVKNKETKNSEIVLECTACGWLQYIDGTEWLGGKVDIYSLSNKEMDNII